MRVIKLSHGANRSKATIELTVDELRTVTSALSVAAKGYRKTAVISDPKGVMINGYGQAYDEAMDLYLSLSNLMVNDND